jgi:hypothetical protein
MQTNRHSRIHSSGLWLGLLAMLLISFGALVSQLSQPAMPAWLNELACSEHASSQHAPASHAGHAELWAKCGYCTLLLHSPATACISLQLNLPCARPAQMQAPAALGERSLAIFPGARSRAPPLYS